MTCFFQVVGREREEWAGEREASAHLIQVNPRHFRHVVHICNPRHPRYIHHVCHIHHVGHTHLILVFLCHISINNGVMEMDMVTFS